MHNEVTMRSTTATSTTRALPEKSWPRTIRTSPSKALRSSFRAPLEVERRQCEGDGAGSLGAEVGNTETERPM